MTLTLHGRLYFIFGSLSVACSGHRAGGEHIREADVRTVVRPLTQVLPQQPRRSNAAVNRIILPGVLTVLVRSQDLSDFSVYYEAKEIGQWRPGL